MSVELRRFIIDPQMDPATRRLGIILNRLIARDRGDQPGRIWLLDDDGDQRAMSGSEGILPGDVLTSGNYPFWARSAAGNHGRFTHSSGTPDVLRVQDAGLTVQGAVGITGAVTITGNTAITGTFGVTGNSTLTGTLHVTGAADFDATLNADGAVTLNAAVTLGDNAADAITVTGTMTVAEILTLTKGLVVDTTTLVVDAVNNKIGVLTASPTATLTVAGQVQVTGETTPSGGAGVEVTYNSGSGVGTVLAFDRGGAAWKTLNLGGEVADLRYRNTSRVKVDSTGVGFNGSTPVAPPTLTGSAAAAYDATTRQLINDIKDLLVDNGLAV